MSLPVLLLPCAVAAWRVWRRHAHAAAPRRPPSSSLTACRRVPPRRPPRSSSIPACCCVAPWRRRGFPRRASVRLLHFPTFSSIGRLCREDALRPANHTLPPQRKWTLHDPFPPRSPRSHRSPCREWAPNRPFSPRRDRAPVCSHPPRREHFPPRREWAAVCGFPHRRVEGCSVPP